MQTEMFIMPSEGIRALVDNGNRLVPKFISVAGLAMAMIGGVTLVIGKPGAEQCDTEDGGRTMILPFPENLPKVYMLRDEATGKILIMLASEYIAGLNRKGE